MSVPIIADRLHFSTKAHVPLDPPTSRSAPPPLECVAEMSLVFFCQREKGQLAAAAKGLGGRLATGRYPLLLNTHTTSTHPSTPLRLASAHCCQPSSNQQPSMRLAAEGVSNQLLAPRVKNPKPYHFVNGYL